MTCREMGLVVVGVQWGAHMHTSYWILGCQLMKPCVWLLLLTVSHLLMWTTCDGWWLSSTLSFGCWPGRGRGSLSASPARPPSLSSPLQLRRLTRWLITRTRPITSIKAGGHRGHFVPGKHGALSRRGGTLRGCFHNLGSVSPPKKPHVCLISYFISWLTWDYYNRSLCFVVLTPSLMS